MQMNSYSDEELGGSNEAQVRHAVESKPKPRNLPTIGALRAFYQTRVYLSFFLGRNCEVCPHFFFRQLVARGGKRA